MSSRQYLNMTGRPSQPPSSQCSCPTNPDKRLKTTNFLRALDNELMSERYITLQDYLRIHPRPKNIEFYEAIDCLRRAEKSAAFKKAMLAAERAATSAPTEKKEEMATAAGAQALQATNVTSLEKVKKTLVDGDKLIEVVGYIGVTKPKKNDQA